MHGPLPPIFQNLHGPQVRTCIGKLCAFTCSSNIPKLPDSNASATASLDDGGAAGGDPSRGGAAGGDPSRGGFAGGDPSRGGAAGGDSSRSGVPDATDEGVGDTGAGEDAATDSATGVAADSATEDNVAASGDEGAGAADDGVWGCTEEQGVEDCADESDIAAGPTQSSLSHKEVRHMFLQIEHKLLPKDSDMHFTPILHRGNRHWEHGNGCFL